MLTWKLPSYITSCISTCRLEIIYGINYTKRSDSLSYISFIEVRIKVDLTGFLEDFTRTCYNLGLCLNFGVSF